MNRFFILLLIFTCGCTPKTGSNGGLVRINVVDRNGMTQTISSPDRLKKYERTDFTKPQPYQRVVRIFSNPKNKTPYSILTSYHENGHPHQYLEAQDARANGMYREWHDNGNLKIECNVIEGIAELSTEAAQSWIFHGKSQAWNKQGLLEASILYNKGRMDGEALFFHSNGEIWKQEPYLEGARHGITKVFLDNGILFSMQSYSEGQPDGDWVRYWPTEKPAFTETYIAGQLIEGDYFDIEGHHVSKIRNGNGWRATFGRKHLAALTEYQKGQPEGLVKEFNENNELVRHYHLKGSQMHGLETLFYPAPLDDEQPPTPRVSIHWYEGAIQGEVKSWYETGQQESAREMSRNRKHGLATAWYDDGSLMLIEEYQENQLVRGQYLKKGDRHPISKVESGNGTATLYDGTGAFLHRIPYRNGYPIE